MQAKQAPIIAVSPPTSVIFKDLNFAEKVLGFRPKYVNYDLPSKTGGYIPQFYTTIP